MNQLSVPDHHPSILRLSGAIMPYAWGSRTAIAGLLGRQVPSAGPEAELWFGAHPSGPSTFEAQAPWSTLDQAVSAEPRYVLGGSTLARFGPRLPFLLKMLAIESPLSLQAHPSASQAIAGFRAEQRRGVPIDAPDRVYRDSYPKPELLCALTPVDALCGFRDPALSASFLERLGVPELQWLVDDLARRGEAALGDAVRTLLTWPAASRAQLVASVLRHAHSATLGEDEAARVASIVALGARYPRDPGVIVTTLLNLVRLEPGESIYLDSGNLHAYLRGTAIEVMASSDNVVRGGLTAKHIDVDGLLAVLDTTPSVEPRAVGQPVVAGVRYDSSDGSFALERMLLAGTAVSVEQRGPSIVFVVDGEVEAIADETSLVLAAGHAALVPAVTRELTLRGTGLVFRATVGDPRQPTGR